MVLEQLNQNLSWVNAQTLIIPETGNSAFIELANMSGKDIVILYKSSKEDIKNHLNIQTMMKAEREKLFKSFDDMNVIKMAEIAGNQRKRFVNCLFKPLDINLKRNTIFFDDSVFSGYTFLAAQYCLQNIAHTNIVLFDKTD